ncbi:unnamed protein product [Durusdinium trenchii]|uniref:A to I editase domain-containing protein n=1 Tax=Durusdinium trenchii TaxID=1381693 RepID=A0ABP0RD70_9DINO
MPVLTAVSALAAGAAVLLCRSRCHSLRSNAQLAKTSGAGNDESQLCEQKRPNIRNAEKDRPASCAFAERVASTAKEAYLLRRPLAHRQTVLASILALRGEELFVISFGVGTKFLDGEAISHRDVVRDLHGEVLARRGFLRFLHEDVLRCLSGEEAELVEHNGEEGCKLRDDVSLHLYTSSVPCGNASWKRWAKGGSTCSHVDPNSPLWPKQMHPQIHFHARAEGQAAFLVKSESKELQAMNKSIGPLPVGTALFQSELGRREQGPLTCSDKVAQWSALGLCDDLLSAAFAASTPRLASCTIGRKFSWPHAARALCCRLQGFHRGQMKELPQGYGLQHLDLFGCSVKLDDGVYEDGAGADFTEHRCLVWTRGDEAAEILDGRTGLVAETGAISRISKLSLTELASKWQEFIPAKALEERRKAYREAKTLGPPAWHATAHEELGLQETSRMLCTRQMFDCWRKKMHMVGRWSRWCVSRGIS